MVLSKEHPPSDPLSFGRAGADANTAAGMQRDRRPRCVPHRIDGATISGLSNRFDVYYGMADSRIGVARLDMPDFFTARRSRRLHGSKGVMRSVWFVGRPLSDRPSICRSRLYFAGNNLRQFSRVRKRLVPRGQPILLQQVRHNIQRLRVV